MKSYLKIQKNQTSFGKLWKLIGSPNEKATTTSIWLNTKKSWYFLPGRLQKLFKNNLQILQANLASNIVKKLPDSTGKFGIPSVQQHYEGLRICEKKNEQEVQLQWTPAFTRQRVGYQSNQKPLHHYQHLTKQLNSYIHS